MIFCPTRFFPFLLFCSLKSGAIKKDNCCNAVFLAFFLARKTFKRKSEPDTPLQADKKKLKTTDAADPVPDTAAQTTVKDEQQEEEEETENSNDSPVKKPSRSRLKKKAVIASESEDEEEPVKRPKSPVESSSPVKKKSPSPTKIEKTASPKTTSPEKAPVASIFSKKPAKSEASQKPKEAEKSSPASPNKSASTDKEAGTAGTPKAAKNPFQSFFSPKTGAAAGGKDKGNAGGADYTERVKKTSYHPVNDCFWGQGEKTPYLALANTLLAIEETSSRLRIIEILANYFRSVMVQNPGDLLPSIYLTLNRLS